MQQPESPATRGRRRERPADQTPVAGAPGVVPPFGAAPFGAAQIRSGQFGSHPTAPPAGAHPVGYLPTQPAPMLQGHIIVIGATTTAVRLVEELRRSGEDVVVVVPGEPDQWVLDDLTEVSPRLVSARVVREQAMREAQIELARVVVVLGQHDVEALRLALLVEELNAGANIVLEMRQSAISARLHALLGHCLVVSPAELAAPSFVSAAMSGGDVASFEIAGRGVVAGDHRRVGGQLLAVLGQSTSLDDGGLLGEQGDIVLGTEVLPDGRHSQARQSGFWGALGQVIDHRARAVLLFLLSLIVLSTVFFRFVGGLDWLMALYVALTASTLTGIGDINDLSLWARFGAVTIQLVGLVLSSGLTAVIVDALISARLSDLAGGVRGRPRHHVVVCGLGRVGTIVALLLKQRGVPVVAIEQKDDAPGVAEVRRAGVPVVVAPANNVASLEQAGIQRADAVLAVTDADAANLEIAMVAKEIRPDLNVVTRLFDEDLARRVGEHLDLGTTRSVSMVAAPVVAAAASGRRVEHIVSVGRRVVLLSEVTIEAGTEACGLPTRLLDEPGHVRVLAVRPQNGHWDWSLPQRPLQPGDRIAVAASRLGLARMLTRVRWAQTTRSMRR